nr:recq-mediated genome instability protein 1 [Quercus suber]
MSSCRQNHMQEPTLECGNVTAGHVKTRLPNHLGTFYTLSRGREILKLPRARSESRCRASNENTMSNPQEQVTAYLTSQHLPPSPSFLATLLPTIRPNTPLQPMQRTALFRLLASDLRTSLSPSASTLPASIADPTVREIHLAPAPVPVQVLDVEDIGRSRWAQVESLEAEERGETKKGQEIIRVVPSDEQQQPGGEGGAALAAGSAGPHKLLLQDAAGREVYGLEIVGLPGVGVRMAIGSKILLKGTTVARGVLMLEPGRCEVLGGKVESWDRKWREERKGVLKQRAGWTGDAVAAG